MTTKKDVKDFAKKIFTNIITKIKQLFSTNWIKRLKKSDAEPNTKKRSLKLPITLAVLLLSAGYFWGSWYYSKDRQLDHLSDNITSGVTKKMASATVTPDGNNISPGELIPLKKLVTKQTNITAQIRTIIEHESTYSNFEVIKVGRYFGIFPKYKIALKRRKIIVETNVNKPVFKIAGKSVKAKNQNGEYYLQKDIPGLYSVDIGSKSSKIQKTERVTVPVSGESDLTEVEVTMKYTPSP